MKRSLPGRSVGKCILGRRNRLSQDKEASQSQVGIAGHLAGPLGEVGRIWEGTGTLEAQASFLGCSGSGRTCWEDDFKEGGVGDSLLLGRAAQGAIQGRAGPASAEARGEASWHQTRTVPQLTF